MTARSELVCLSPGRPPSLLLRQAALPEVGPRQVLLRVLATSVNPIDAKRAQGYGQRLLGLKGAGKFPMVLGNDVAGEVMATGDAVNDLKSGDRVMGLMPTGRGGGAHASHVLVNRALLRPLPPNLSPPEAAVLPYSFTTAWLALQRLGIGAHNARGLTILVHGASGGLGQLALQLLSHWRADVTAVCATAEMEACRALGASHVVDRTRTELASLPSIFDATLNFATWQSEAELIARLKPGALGHATTVHPLLGSFDEHGWIGGALAAHRAWRTMRARLRHQDNRARYKWIVFQPDGEALDLLRRHLSEGRLRLPVGLSVPLSKAALAFQHVNEQRAGRAVLLPA